MPCRGGEGIRSGLVFAASSVACFGALVQVTVHLILYNLLLSFCFWPLHLIHLLVALSMRIPLICTACYFRVVRLGYEFYLLHALLIVLIIYTIPNLLAQLLFIVPIFIVIMFEAKLISYSFLSNSVDV